ncbi:MAG: HU family DNA-binding protein [Acetobacteraceae bacterium]|nr:HU family DNA-binding protein [Acetobacteraceae bacterium]
MRAAAPSPLRPPVLTGTAAFVILSAAIARGEDISIPRFGKFKAMDRPAREGRNPATGEAIQIAASRKAAFASAEQLKDKLNGAGLLIRSPNCRRRIVMIARCQREAALSDRSRLCRCGGGGCRYRATIGSALLFCPQCHPETHTLTLSPRSEGP